MDAADLEYHHRSLSFKGMGRSARDTEGFWMLCSHHLLCVPIYLRTMSDLHYSESPALWSAYRTQMKHPSSKLGDY